MDPKPRHDPRIDQKIDAAAPFAQPILRYIRRAIHEALPGIEEAIKWGMPFYLIDGRPFAMMASFKAHAAFGFWRGRETGKQDDAMGQYGRLTAIDDLPPREAFVALIRDTAAASAAARPAPPKPKTARPEVAEPAAFTAALAANAAARAGFDALPPGARREYLDWIVEAKRDQTRATRIARAVDQCAEGKKLNWKYEKGC